MKNVSFILITLFLFSCGNTDKKQVKNIDKQRITMPTESKPNTTGTEVTINDNKPDEGNFNEVMLESDILFNGKLNRYFTTKEFQNVFGKADSIKLMTEEAPCNYIFDNEDGSKDDEDKYFYQDGSTFENSKNKMAVQEFKFSKNNFILYKGTKLNASTNIKDLRKLFPNAVKNIGTMDVYQEGELQVIQLREDANNVSDGHINIFIRGGMLYSMHWWFPC